MENEKRKYSKYVKKKVEIKRGKDKRALCLSSTHSVGDKAIKRKHIFNIKYGDISHTCCKKK